MGSRVEYPYSAGRRRVSHSDHLPFFGGGFGFPASLRFFRQVPSWLRARGSLLT